MNGLKTGLGITVPEQIWLVPVNILCTYRSGIDPRATGFTELFPGKMLPAHHSRGIHWLCLLMILFMRHSDRGDIDKHHHLRANSYTE